MAGTISLSLSQQFNKYGEVLAGGKLYLFQAGTVATPQNGYQDSNLTLVLPNPITLDEAGRIPQFFLADGSIKIRLTDADGVVQIAADGILVIGASSGGGGGSTVDATTVFTTGDIKSRLSSDTVTGWVRINGRTIGSATSGATERANSDVSALYAYIWNNFSNAVCPVLTGRGANAAADFAANKQMTLFDLRGRTMVGFDDMGNTTAARLASALFGTGDGVTVGSNGGEATHTLLTAEIPAHSHAVTDTGHTHLLPLQQNSPTGGGGADVSTGSNLITSASAVTGISIQNTGGGTSHNNMPPFAVTNWFWKL